VAQQSQLELHPVQLTAWPVLIQLDLLWVTPEPLLTVKNRDIPLKALLLLVPMLGSLWPSCCDCSLCRMDVAQSLYRQQNHHDPMENLGGHQLRFTKGWVEVSEKPTFEVACHLAL